MNRQSLLTIGLVFVLVSVCGVMFKVQKVKASGTIYIRPDGSIDPLTANITNTNNVTYLFIDDNYDNLIIEKDNIVVDGLGYKLEGGMSGFGIYLSGITNVTIKNMDIRRFDRGIQLYNSSLVRIIGNNISDNDSFGVYLESATNNTISENYIVNNGGGTSYSAHSSLRLSYSSYNTIFQNNITENSYLDGVGFWSSLNNTVYENNISNNYMGIRYDQSSNNNNVYGNNVSSNLYGIYLIRSLNNTCYNNSLDDNEFGFYIYGDELSHYLHNIETSNLVNGKPAYYLINHHNYSIRPSTHPEIGFLALINSTSINVEGQKLIKNGLGLLLAYTNNSRIAYNNITGNYDGLKNFSSFNNSIYRNNIVANEYRGIYFWDSNGSKISENIIVDNNDLGIYLSESSNNLLYGNTIANSEYAIELDGLNNSIYLNNFVNNTQQIDSYDFENLWDNGFEGNYWSDYNGTDTNSDGIGDVPYEIDLNNTDHYPLVGMFHSFNTSLGKHVNVISNSTIDDFEYCQPCNFIRINVSNMTANQTQGFCRIAIPYEVMSEPFYVTINGVNPTYWNYTLYDNGTHRWIYFSYEHSTLQIVIVPEFSLSIILPLFMIATLAAAIVYRKHNQMH